MKAKLLSVLALLFATVTAFADSYRIDASKAITAEYDELDGVVAVVTNLDGDKTWAAFSGADGQDINGNYTTVKAWGSMSEYSYIKFFKLEGHPFLYYIKFVNANGDFYVPSGTWHDGSGCMNVTGNGAGLFVGGLAGQDGQDAPDGAVWHVEKQADGIYTFYNLGKERFAVPGIGVTETETAVRLYTGFVAYDAEAEGDYSGRTSNDRTKWDGATGVYGGGAERYNGGGVPAGEVLTQTITGLPSGKYLVAFNGIANVARDLDNSVWAGEGKAYVFANSTTKDITIGTKAALDQADWTAGEHSLECEVGQDGILKYGLANKVDAGQWYVAKAISLTRTGDLPSAAGTEEDPIILTAGVPANGPKAAGEYPYTYTYYQYTATQAGVIKLNTADLGYIMGNIIVGGKEYGYGSSVVVAEGDVVTVKLTAQADATAKTFTLTIRDLAEGESQANAKALAEGSNNIAAIQNGGLPMWYSINVPAGKELKIVFAGYPSAKIIANGEEKAVEYADAGYTGTYANNTENDVVAYVVVSALSTACTANVTIADAAPVLPPITKMGQPAFFANTDALAEGAALDAAPNFIRIMFPETDAQPEDVVTANAMVFEIGADGNPTGAPLNMEKYEYTSTVQDGIAISNVQFEAGKTYKVQLSTVYFREVADLGYRKEYAYTYPNSEENPTTITNELSFSVKASTATTFAITGATNAGNEAGEVEALSYMFEITSANAITALHEGNITLTDAENQPVGGNAMVLGYEGEEGATTVYARFTFDTEDHQLHTAGVYTLNVPAGMFQDAEGNLNEAFTATWTIKEQGETSTFAITGATNAGNAPESEVEVLSYMFEITAANAITALHEGNITLTDAENQPVGGYATVVGYEGEEGATTVYARFTFDTEDHQLHTPGVYTLNVPAGMFADAEGNLSEAYTATWTVVAPEKTVINITNVAVDNNDPYTVTMKFNVPAEVAEVAETVLNMTLNGEAVRAMKMTSATIEEGVATIVFTDDKTPEVEGAPEYRLQPGTYVAFTDIQFKDAEGKVIENLEAKYIGSIVLEEFADDDTVIVITDANGVIKRIKVSSDVKIEWKKGSNL